MTGAHGPDPQSASQYTAEEQRERRATKAVAAAAAAAARRAFRQQHCEVQWCGEGNLVANPGG